MGSISQADGNQGVAPVSPGAPPLPAKPAAAVRSAEPTITQPVSNDSTYRQGPAVPRGSIPATGIVGEGGPSGFKIPTTFFDKHFGTIKVNQVEAVEETSLLQRFLSWIARA